MKKIINLIIWPISSLVIGIFMIHHHLINLLMDEYFLTHYYFVDLVYRKTFSSTANFALWQNYLMCGISYIVNFPFMYSVSRLLTLAGLSPIFSLGIQEYIFMVSGIVCFFLLMRLYGYNRYVCIFSTLLYQFFLYKWIPSESCPMAFAPVIFLVCEKYQLNPRFLFIALGAIAVGIACTSGIIHGILFIFIFQFVLVVYYLLWGIQRKYALAFIFSWAIGLILSLPVLLPQIRDVASSQRQFYSRYLLNISTLRLPEFLSKLKATMLLPHFFPVFLISAVLAVIAVFYLKGKKITGFYFLSALTVFLFIFLSFTQELWRNVPLIGKYVIAFDLIRGMAVIGFLSLYLSAFTINCLVTKAPANKNSMLIGGLTLLVLSCCLILSHLSFATIFIGAGVLTFVLINLYLPKISARKANLVFSLLLSCSLIAYFSIRYIQSCRIFTKESGRPLVRSVILEKYLSYNTDLLPAETLEQKQAIVNMIKGSTESEYFRVVDISGFKIDYHDVRFLPNQIYSPFGLANIYPARYFDFFKWLIDDLRVKSPENYQFFVTTKGAPVTYGLGSSYNKNLLSLAGVKWIVVPNEINETRFEKIITGSKYSLYRNNQVFPRAFGVFGLRVFKDKGEMARFMIAASEDELMKEVPITASDAVGLSLNTLTEGGSGVAKIVRYLPNEVVIEADFKDNGLLVLTDNFHKNWNATVDGVYSKIYPAYYTFRMVLVPKGEHTVRFYFKDQLFYYTSLLALATLILIISILLFEKSRKQKRL